MNKFLRPISSEEAAIVRRTLEVAAVLPVSQEVLNSIDALQVTALCSCGCRTVWFGPEGEASIGRILADGWFQTAGGSVGVIVWLDREIIVGLELVYFDGDPTVLPNPEDIRGYGS
jgi:hypothetical protein